MIASKAVRLFIILLAVAACPGFADLAVTDAGNKTAETVTGSPFGGTPVDMSKFNGKNVQNQNEVSISPELAKEMQESMAALQKKIEERNKALQELDKQ